MPNEILLKSARLAQDSYSVRPRLFGRDYLRFDTADKTDTVFLFSTEKLQLLVFRGTDSILDWLQNLEFIPDHEIDGYFVHGGFSRGARELYEQFYPALDERPIRLVGHSLGGALAVICSMQLVYDGKDVHSVHTFGAPRPFDMRGARVHQALQLPQRTAQVRNGDDIVCRVMLSSPGGNKIGAWHPFCHAVHLDGDDTHFGAEWWEKVRQRMPNTVKRLENAADHLMDHAVWNYVKALEKF